jgi:hypothetical protein
LRRWGLLLQARSGCYQIRLRRWRYEIQRRQNGVNARILRVAFGRLRG